MNFLLAEINKRPLVPQLVFDNELRIALCICGTLVGLIVGYLFFQLIKP
jgi:hypothetical protein